MRVRYTRLAQRDIEDIFDHIQADSPQAALEVEATIRNKAEALSDFPEIGVMTDLKDVRRFPLTRYPYTIFYRIDWSENTVDILRVVHAARIRDLDTPPD